MALREENIIGVRTRRRYGNEVAWFPLLEEFGALVLRDALIECNVAPRIAGVLVFFLDDQIQLRRHQSDTARVEYRRILASLDIDEVRSAANQAIPR
jgi:hypothetical protein